MDFEIFPDDYRIAFYPMDADWTQLGFQYARAKGLFSGRQVDPFDDEDDLDDPAVTEKAGSLEERLNEMVVRWFYQCWKRSVGTDFTVPAYVCIHDSNLAFDLVEEEYIDRSL